MKYGLFILLLCTLACKEAVLNDLSEKKAASALIELHQHGITAKKVRSAAGWSVLVDTANVAMASAALSRRGFLRTEVKEESSSRLLLSRSERALYTQRAISARLEETLETLPEVYDAKVNLNLASQDSLLLQDSSNHSSASAVLIVGARFALSEESLRRIIRGAAAIENSRIEILLVEDVRFDGLYPTASAPAAQSQTPQEDAKSKGLVQVLNGVPQAHRYGIAAASALLFGVVCIFFSRRRSRAAFSERMKTASEQELHTEIEAETQGIFQTMRQRNEVMQ